MTNGSSRPWWFRSVLGTGLGVFLLGIAGAGTAVAQGPEMTGPVPGTVLPGPNVTFQWTASSTAVTEWWLYVGSSPGAAEILDSGALGASLSLDVSGIPADGRTIWVRLWFRVDGLWEFTDFQFTAANAALAQPRITSPAPGSTLPGATVTFQWMADGAAVTEWWLYIGSSPGASEILDSGALGASLSATVSGLPESGGPIYVRLWFRIGGLWESEDFQYSVNPGAPDVPWSWMGAGGGSSSSGGAFRLGGSVGQPVTAASTAGGLLLRGGFWPVVVVP